MQPKKAPTLDQLKRRFDAAQSEQKLIHEELIVAAWKLQITIELLRKTELIITHGFVSFRPDSYQDGVS